MTEITTTEETQRTTTVWTHTKAIVREVYTDESGKISSGRILAHMSWMLAVALVFYGIQIYLDNPKTLPLLNSFLLPVVGMMLGVGGSATFFTQFASSRVKAAERMQTLPPSPSSAQSQDGGK